MRQQPIPSIEDGMRDGMRDHSHELKWNPLMMQPWDERRYRVMLEDELDHQGLNIALPGEDQARAPRGIDWLMAS